MFTALAPMQPSPNPSLSYYPWTPTRPSPLSPRQLSPSSSAMITTPTQQPQVKTGSPSSSFTFFPSPASPPSRNDPNGNFSPESNSLNTNTTATATATTPSKYANRYTATISKPLLSHSTKRTFTTSASASARCARRNAFLNRVKQDRNNGRFEARAEHLAFMEGVAEQREWVEDMRRKAEDIERNLDPDFEMDGEGFDGDEEEIRELDEYLEQEHALEMEFLERMEPPQGGRPGAAVSSFSDDEYDDIFTSLSSHDPPLDMDMSC
ncbi:uncharacterized protein BJX67DRAFT_380055 [Aspergillus lucknowensis]|uniref:BZIP domain-containing protein n=1 Tax=Aspergillus lucknowensis TaxID=176173 RepID=A0ABR4LUK3_9EURO